MGYFTKYGDGAVDVEVIGDLFKTDVKQLADYLKIPKKIIDKVPSAELYPGQTDEKELGISYDKLDRILKLYIGEGLAISEVVSKGFNKKLVNKVVERIKSNEHKRNMPMVIRAPKW
jgi:NAD+ synthase